MSNSNEKGFAAVEAIIIVIIVGLISGTGWYVYSKSDSKKANNTIATNANSANQAGSATPNPETVDWYKYESTNKAYTIRLANGLNFTTYQVRNVEDLGLYTINELAVGAAIKATVDESKKENESFFGDGLSMDITFNGSGGPEPDGERFTSFKTEQNKTVNGYKFEQDETGANTKILTGAKVYTYLINGNSNAAEGDSVAYFTATYIVDANKEGNLSLLEEMLKTVYIAD
jgi:hypothetical protein